MYDRLTDYFPVDRQHAKFYFTIRLSKLLGHKDIGRFNTFGDAFVHARKTYTSSQFQIVQINEV